MVVPFIVGCIRTILNHTTATEEYGDDAAEFDADEIHTFVVPKGYHWNDVRAVSENVGVAIVEAFRKVENANIDKLQGIFGDGAWTNKNRLPDRLLKDASFVYCRKACGRLL